MLYQRREYSDRIRPAEVLTYDDTDLWGYLCPDCHLYLGDHCCERHAFVAFAEHYFAQHPCEE
jgi:hypothetical protein